MKLHLAQTAGQNLITGYGDRHVDINNRRHEKSIVVFSDRLIDWSDIAFNDLTEQHFSQLAELSPEVVLLGTGKTLRFPHPRLYQALSKAKVGVEVMDMNAACRTYNILMSEGRKVAAILLIE